jgi:hypothetical protein
MKSSINLASPKNPERKKLAKLLVVSGVIFGITFFIAVCLVFYLLYLKGQLSNLEDNVALKGQELKKLDHERANALRLRDRLSNAEKALSSRGKLNEKVGAVLSLIPEGLAVRGLEYGNSEIQVSLETAQLGLFHEFVENRVKDIEEIKDVEIVRSDISGFDVNPETQSYTMSLLFSFKEGK